MKISQMLEREDFYTINRLTLDGYYGQTNEAGTKLYIYPALNAIVTAKPSKQVVDYLLCEYSVRGNAAKRLAVKSYVLGCMYSGGMMAAKTCMVKADVCPEMLIYPCNKKYRFFNFKKQIVDVVAKYGFDRSDLIHEMAFRCRESLPDFVPRLISSDENGYRETIIDGCPLARMTEGFEAFRDAAYQKLVQYGQPQQRTMQSFEYAKTLQVEIKALTSEKEGYAEHLNAIAEQLVAIAGGSEVTLTFSHGDLQPGNIWIENGTNRIYIIDWESWAERSNWYDRAVLYQGLRGNIQGYLAQTITAQERAIVLLEDLIFRLHEINSLPKDFGVVQFCRYSEELAHWLQIGE
jgi:hypothetical protein